jgi:hypothetical protein
MYIKCNFQPCCDPRDLHPSGHSPLHFFELFLGIGPVCIVKLVEGLLWVSWAPLPAFLSHQKHILYLIVSHIITGGLWNPPACSNFTLCNLFFEGEQLSQQHLSKDCHGSHGIHVILLHIPGANISPWSNSGMNGGRCIPPACFKYGSCTHFVEGVRKPWSCLRVCNSWHDVF